MTKKQSLKAVPLSMDHKEIFTNYDERMHSFQDQVSDMITEQAHKINAEKERLFKERLYALTGEDIDIVAEMKRMFPRIAGKISQVDKSEAFFWNDGTEFGKLIITFHPFEEMPQFTKDDMTIRINYGFKYK